METTGNPSLEKRRHIASLIFVILAIPELVAVFCFVGQVVKGSLSHRGWGGTYRAEPDLFGAIVIPLAVLLFMSPGLYLLAGYCRNVFLRTTRYHRFFWPLSACYNGVLLLLGLTLVSHNVHPFNWQAWAASSIPAVGTMLSLLSL
jgi:hypothetical protein